MEGWTDGWMDQCKCKYLYIYVHSKQVKEKEWRALPYIKNPVNEYRGSTAVGK